MTLSSPAPRRRLFYALLCFLMAAQSIAASASSGHPASPAASNSTSNFNLNFHFGKDIALVSVGIGVVVGVGVYFLVRQGPGITGCPRSGSAGLHMQDEAGKHDYLLTGRTALLQPDRRIRVYGKKQKQGNETLFIVKKHSKELGPCTIAP